MPATDANGNPGAVAAGELIESAWGTAAADRVVKRYPTKAALDAVAAANGSLAVTTDTGTVWQRYATGWHRPWNQPWGIQAIGQSTLSGGGQQAMIDIASTGPYTVTANRRLKLTSLVNMANGGAQATMTLHITDAANTALQQAVYTLPANFAMVVSTFVVITSGAGTPTHKTRLGSNAPFALSGAANSIHYIVSEDIGPATPTP